MLITTVCDDHIRDFPHLCCHTEHRVGNCLKATLCRSLNCEVFVSQRQMFQSLAAVFNMRIHQNNTMYMIIYVKITISLKRCSLKNKLKV